MPYWSLSSAKPKISSHPLATKKVSIGIFESAASRYQEIDTPSLLDRPYKRRSKIEKQVISALRHMVLSIAFVLSPTETCGYQIQCRLKLLESMKEDFDVPILEIENKLDLQESDSGRLKVSALTGEGIEELRAMVLQVLKAGKPK